MPTPSWLTTRLSKDERSDLKRCERIIKRGSKVFIQVSEALMEIRDKRLYRENYPTFDEYCKDKWGFTARHGQRLLAAKEVADNVRPIGRIPDHESQARPMVGLPPETQREVWQEAVESADDGKITAERVAEIAEPHKVEPPAPEPTPEPAGPVDWAAVLQPQAFYVTHPHQRVVYQTAYFSHWEAARAAEKGMVPQRGAYIIKSDIFKPYRFEKLVRPNDSTPEAQALHAAGIDDSTSPDEPTTPRHDPREVSNAGEWTPNEKAYLKNSQTIVNRGHAGKMPFVGNPIDEVARLKARIAELEAENEALRLENTHLKVEIVVLRNKVQPSDPIGKPAERIHQ